MRSLSVVVMPGIPTHHTSNEADAIDSTASAILDHVLAAPVTFGDRVVAAGELFDQARATSGTVPIAVDRSLKRAGIIWTYQLKDGAQYLAIARTGPTKRLFSARKIVKLCAGLQWWDWLALIPGVKMSHQCRFWRETYHAVLVPIAVVDQLRSAK